METPTRVLLVPLSTQGHWTPFLYIIRHLIAHNVNITLCTCQDRADEMKQYEMNGDFRNVDVETVVVFSHTKTAPLVPDLTCTMEKELKLKRNELKPDRFSCLIADMFMVYCQDLADEWGIPYFNLNPAASYYILALFHGARIAHEGWFCDNPAKEDKYLEAPGLENFTVRELNWPEILKDNVILHSRQLRKCAGILINTFEELEQKSLDVLRCQLKDNELIGRVTPKVFSIGPLFLFPTLASIENQSQEASEYEKWLDKRPKSSVLFICFGSQAGLPLPNVMAIAKALQHTQVSFLWALRLPPQTRKEDAFPPNFEARTHERGLVVTGWIKQQEVLLHPSTGAFLSHCGWNSCMESMRAGVPILAHPMWADQHMNAKFLAKTVRVAVEIKHDLQQGSCEYTWQEVAKAIQMLFVEDEGEHVRSNMLTLQQAALEATTEGGASCQSFQELINEIKQPT